MSSGADVWALVAALLVTVAPGGALLLALGVRRPLWWVAVSPPASVGVATLTAMACATLSVRYGPGALGVATVLLAAVGLFRLRSCRTASGLPGPPIRPRDGEGPDGLPVRAGGLGEWLRRSGDRVPGLGLVAAGVGLGVLVWTYGLGTMATVGQEHDLIVHGVLTAYIQQSGHGAPWQLMPADVLTGDGVTFYPAGLHLLMAATATLTGSTVVGINAVSAVVLGAGWTSGSAALAHVTARRAKLEAGPALVAAGMAAIVAAGLYRPTIALVQWGGTVPNSATLALTPGLLAAILTLPPAHRAPNPTSALSAPSPSPFPVRWRKPLRYRISRPGALDAAGGSVRGGGLVVGGPAGSWGTGRRVGGAIAVGVAVAGMLAIHPSAVVTVGVSAVAWWAGEAVGADGRRRLVGQVVPLALAGIVAVALAVPMLLAMSRVAGTIGAFQPDVDPISVADALDRTVRMTYNVGDPRQKLAAAQLAAAGLALLGAVVLTVTRRSLGAVTAWSAWVVIVVATWVRPGQGVPGLLTNVFYDAQLRVWSHASLFVPTLAGVGFVLGATVVADALGSRLGQPAGAARAAWRRRAAAETPVVPLPQGAAALDPVGIEGQSGEGSVVRAVDPVGVVWRRAGTETPVVELPRDAAAVGPVHDEGQRAALPATVVARWDGQAAAPAPAPVALPAPGSAGERPEQPEQAVEPAPGPNPDSPPEQLDPAIELALASAPGPNYGGPSERRDPAVEFALASAPGPNSGGPSERRDPAVELALASAPGSNSGGPPGRLDRAWRTVARPWAWAASHRHERGASREGSDRPDRLDRAWRTVVLAGLLALAYLVGPGYRYSRADVEALASRYARPDYTRVSAGDRHAVEWLADRVGPGERVLNSANDGSTLLYVERRLPIVNVASLGSAVEPASYRLLEGFNRYPADPDVRRMLRDLDVRWIYVDTSAPTISASGAPSAWVAGNWLSVPEGFRHLGGLPGLERRFRSGTVSIYHLDPSVLG